MDLQKYFENELNDGKIDFKLRVRRTSNGRIHVYIHPEDKDGRTLDMYIEGNELDIIIPPRPINE